MSKFATRERRQHERFPQTLDIRAQCLHPIQSPVKVTKEFEGRILNLSNGGACILSSCALAPDVFVLCRLPLADAPVSIPTLMQVRWTSPRGREDQQFVSGFQFVS